MVSVLDCQSWGLGFKPRPGQKFGSIFLFQLRPLANSAMMSTLTAHCQWEDETARERTGHPPSYAVAKKMKSLTFHTHGCLRASLRDWSSSTYRRKCGHFYVKGNAGLKWKEIDANRRTLPMTMVRWVTAELTWVHSASVLTKLLRALSLRSCSSARRMLQFSFSSSFACRRRRRILWRVGVVAHW